MKISSTFLALSIVLMSLQSCSSSSPAGLKGESGATAEFVGNSLNNFLKESYSDTRSIEVLYATNRTLSSDKPDCSDKSFTVAGGDKVFYGSCKVNVPKRHAVGSFEIAPTPRSDPHQYFRFMGQRSFDFEGLKKSLEAKGKNDILLFVHGFNVKFEEAMIRAAQIAYDVKFQGSVVVFTWPAGSGDGFLDSTLITRTYNANAANAASSIPVLAAFLKSLSELPVNIHMMVHSMGHQVSLPALAQVADSISHPILGELILNAPDFPVDQFQELAPKIQKIAHRITVYCSYNDNAIAASERYNKGRRMGACERADGIDVINVGEIDAPSLGVAGLGHGYYASRPILGDVYQVLLRIDAERRLFIRKSEPNAVENFYLRP